MPAALSIIIPVYNEEKTIIPLLQKVLAAELPAGVTREVIVINDGSSDGSWSKLQTFKNHPQVKLFQQQKNSGKTAALRLGIEKAGGDIILIQDADFEYNPIDYPALLKPVLQGEVAVVYGSRLKGSTTRMTLINRFANIVSTATFNLLFGTRLTDINTCYKVFKKATLENIEITSRNFTFETEITAKLVGTGHTIKEVPIHYSARSKDEGKKITWAKALEMYSGIIRYRFSQTPPRQDILAMILYGMIALACLGNLYRAFIIFPKLLPALSNLTTASFPGEKFAVLRPHLSGIKKVGYFTDWSSPNPMRDTVIMGDFQMAQFVLSPCLIDYFGWTEYSYIVFNCISQQSARAKMKEIGAIPLFENGRGMALVKKINQ